LKDVGVTDYEPKVIDQMLDFAYKYVTNVVEDAKSYSTHCKKRTIDNEDIKLAIELQCDKSFTSPPPREQLMEIARSKNSQQLPLIKSTTGARLPPDRYTLTSTNFRCKTKTKAQQRAAIQAHSQLASKTAPAVNISSKTGATLAVVSKSNAAQTSQVTIVSRPALVQSSTSSTAPRPLIKLATNTRPAGAPMINTMSKPKPLTVAGMPSINVTQNQDRKRKAEEEAC